MPIHGTIKQEDIKASLVEAGVAVALAGLFRGRGDPSVIFTRESLTVGLLLAVGAMIVRIFAPELLKGFQGGLAFFSLRNAGGAAVSAAGA